MSNLYTSNGTPIEIGGGDGKQVFGGNYENNFRNIFTENFKAVNADFTLTNCSVSANGLSCSAFAKAEYKKGTAIDYSYAIAKFKYSSACVVGLYIGATVAWVDTANLTFNMGSNWNSTSTLPTAAETENITFAFVDGEEYSIALEKKATNVTATIFDAKGVVKISLTHSATTQCLGTCGVVCFNGNCYFTALSYYLPLAVHSRCLILGDSITEGDVSNPAPTARHAWKLLTDYFHNDCVISGVGYGTTRTAMERFRLLTAMGYTFDYVLMFLGTNDGNMFYTDEDIPKYTGWLEGWIAEIEATGAKVMWGFPPMRSAGYADSQRRVRTGILAVTPPLDLIRFDLATQNAQGEMDSSLYTDQTHPNAAGHAKMYDVAKRTLEILGV